MNASAATPLLAVATGKTRHMLSVEVARRAVLGFTGVFVDTAMPDDGLDQEVD